MKPLAELKLYLTNWLREARGKHAYAELAGVEVAQDITAGLDAQQQKLAATAHQAETYDREALRAMDDATAPDSEGGPHITPKEALKIRRFVSLSAERDHDAAEMAGA